MKFNKKYWDFFETTFAREDFVVLQGGKRAGKTFAILQYLFIQLIQAPKHAVIVTDTFARLRDSILSDFEIIRGEYPSLCRVITSGTPRIDFLNGSQITFCCADRDARGFTSNKSYIFFNECIMYGEDVARDILKAGADGCKVFFDYNPFTRFWVNDTYETPTNKMVTTYADNPFCPAFAKRMLQEQAEKGKTAKAGTMERYLYEVECLGSNAELSGLCFPNAEICAESEYDECAVPEILASDWGQYKSIADPDVVCGFKFSGGCVYMREYYYRNDGTDADIAECLQAIPFARQWFVFETATQGKQRVTDIFNLCRLRFRFVPCTKGAGSVMIGIRNLQEYRLKITDGSKNVQNEQRNYKYVNRGGVLAPVDKYNHAFDCLRYAYDFFINNKSKI